MDATRRGFLGLFGAAPLAAVILPKGANESAPPQTETTEPEAYRDVDDWCSVASGPGPWNIVIKT